MKIRILKAIFILIVVGIMTACNRYGGSISVSHKGLGGNKSLEVHKGLDRNKLSEYNYLMVVNDDIICEGAVNIKIAKGEIYTAASLSDSSYKAVDSQNGNGFTISNEIIGHFPSHAIALQGNNRDWAITVNPNGEFLMEERNVLIWAVDNWAMMNFKCKTKNNLKPFKEYLK